MPVGDEKGCGLSGAVLAGEARKWVPDIVAKANGIKVARGDDNLSCSR